MSALDLFTILVGILAGLSSIIVARINTQTDRQKFYENKIAELLEVQSKEIKLLRDEIDRLIKENQALTIEVSNLKYELEKRGIHYDGSIE
jgi:dsDNA-specific endonuclease/ATPase MutS2